MKQSAVTAVLYSGIQEVFCLNLEAIGLEAILTNRKYGLL